jgi:hypothetical protein
MDFNMNTETEIAVLRAIIEEKEKTIKTITDSHPANDFFGNLNGVNTTITYLGNRTASQATSFPSEYYISTGISNNAFTFSSRSV